MMTMRSNERARQAQFELLVNFMEQHGDIQYLPKMECYTRWIELTDLLNNKSLGETKPIEKWRKCWSDFKNNTKKKVIRIRKQESNASLTKIEKRLIKLLEREEAKRKSNKLDSECPVVLQLKTVPDESSCEMPPSPVSLPQNCVQNVEYEMIDHPKPSPSSDGDFSEVNGDPLTSESCYEDNEEAPPKKRNKYFEKNIKNVAEKYLEFERERERLAHEREMARIKQSDQLLKIFGKVVNVLEQLTPNMQKYLDQDTKDDR